MGRPYKGLVGTTSRAGPTIRVLNGISDLMQANLPLLSVLRYGRALGPRSGLGRGRQPAQSIQIRIDVIYAARLRQGIRRILSPWAGTPTLGALL